MGMVLAIMTHANVIFDKQQNGCQCTGNWSVLNLGDVLQRFKNNTLPSSQSFEINGNAIGEFDSAGALALIQCMNELKQRNNHITLTQFNAQQHALLNLVEEKNEIIHFNPRPAKRHNVVYFIGKETINKLSQIKGLVVLIGDLTDKLIHAFGQWRRFQIPSIVSNIASAGLNALPSVGLLSFLIGVVLAYQMGLQLETYGATGFIAYLSGMAIFREFAPLITAIIVAGRTSSAFTAQIGSMKVNEEIDALHTMGLSPTELLVIPKVLGLLFIFPLLIFWSDFFGTLGAMLMSKFMLHVGYYDFMNRLQDAVGFKQMMLGLYKAPAFALLIALVGCFQGFRVEASSDSVGKQTTRSVVQALFLIIVTDATYSIIYSWLDL